ncbi:MAG: MFS transporter [Rhodobiaceae bacterium]|nr:MFS transporter [Rhodobiaceae bacterium]MCC0056081.1 MFS transporter [Rhodobiaceae bacterium]
MTAPDTGPHGEIGLARDPRVWALLLAGMLTIMSNSIIAPALPGIEAMFHDAPNAGLMTRLLVTIPSLMIAIAAPFAGMAADRFGRRRQLLAGTLLFALAGTAGFYLSSLEAILASRMLLGISVAAIMTSTSALIGDYFTGIARARLAGYQVAVMNFAAFFFVMAAGFMASSSAVLPFLIYAVSLPLLPLFIAVLKEPSRHGHETSQALPGDEGQPRWILTVAAVSILAGIGFVLYYLVPTQVPYYLVSIGHSDPSAAGWVMGGVMLVGSVCAMLFARVRPILGRGGTPAFGYAMMMAGLLIFWHFHALPLLVLAGGMIGGGMSFIMPNFVTICLNAAPAARRGAAMGAITTCLFFGQFVSPLTSQPLIAHFGYETTFLFGALALIPIVLGVWLGLQRAPRPPVAMQP